MFTVEVTCTNWFLTGMTRAEILDKLKSLKEKETNHMNGRIFAYTYTLADDHFQLQKEVFDMFTGAATARLLTLFFLLFLLLLVLFLLLFLLTFLLLTTDILTLRVETQTFHLPRPISQSLDVNRSSYLLVINAFNLSP